MPCDFELDLEHRLVRVRASGVFTHAEAMATRQQFTADPAFSSDISLIYDLGAVTRIDMTSDQIRGLARFSPLDQKVRRAIVANEPGVYGAMRMLALDYAANGGLNEIGVFKRIEDAEKWLGLRNSR